MINLANQGASFRGPASTDTLSNTGTQSVSPVRAKRNVHDDAKLWPNGSTLKIALYDTDGEMAEAIKDAINEWLPHVNLKFDFVSGDEGDIRIVLNHFDESYGSALGTDAKNIPAYLPTIILPGDTLSPRFRYVALHEFGHALGALHAHQHPDSNIPWDKQKTYNDSYQRFGWDKDTVDKNILPLARNGQHRYQSYDGNSVMHYGIRSQWTSMDWAQSESWEISDGDIAQMKQAYPKPI
ncbi:M12 family metallopeptidase [Pseudomonas sp. K2I15]|uniref:M12 family metallopeptidase n=1 Tax=unclassified Pseudomonas TaxID=196821 RepID=UPI000B4C2F2C|nr:M12 family metallopeptidase [Pseudomonas sp. K2I15]OWP72721.1 peptidase M12 [Pseudomonas sp. K2I15]